MTEAWTFDKNILCSHPTCTCTGSSCATAPTSPIRLCPHACPIPGRTSYSHRKPARCLQSPKRLEMQSQVWSDCRPSSLPPDRNMLPVCRETWFPHKPAPYVLTERVELFFGFIYTAANSLFKSRQQVSSVRHLVHFRGTVTLFSLGSLAFGLKVSHLKANVLQSRYQVTLNAAPTTRAKFVSLV